MDKTKNDLESLYKDLDKTKDLVDNIQRCIAHYILTFSKYKKGDKVIYNGNRYQVSEVLLTYNFGYRYALVSLTKTDKVSKSKLRYYASETELQKVE